MAQNPLAERIKELGFDPAHYFVSSDAAARLHKVELSKDSGKIHLIASPGLFKKLAEKHKLVHGKDNMPATVIVAPDVAASTKFWDSYRGAVDTIDGVPVLRLGKLNDYWHTVEGQANISDSEAIKAKVASVMADCKKKGKTDRQIGDHLGLTEQAVVNVATKLLGINRTEWHSMGKPTAKAIVGRLEETGYKWNAVEQEFFPGKRSPKTALMKILNGSPEWAAAKKKGK